MEGENPENADSPVKESVRSDKSQLAEEARRRQDAERQLTELQAPLAAAQNEIARLKAELQSAVPHPGPSPTHSTATPVALGSEAALRNENARLRALVKRQNALIDVLRRQKLLLEVSEALNISMKDFDKGLELDKV